MNALFQKISIFILAVACLILIVDKTKQSLSLNGVAARIAEKSAELERERTEFKAVREKLQNEIRMRDETFRLIPPGRKSSGKDVSLPQPADPKDAKLSRMAAKLTGEAGSPARLAWAFRKLAEEQQLFPDIFRIDSASGLVVSQAASLLSLAAKSAGMDVRTTLVWDMREFKPRASIEILPLDLPDRKTAAAPVTVHLTETGKAPPADSRFSLRQERAESVVFPFEAKWQDAAKEQTLLPPGGLIPCGGLYLHFVSSECGSAWFLEYEFPENVSPKDVDLQVVPLDMDMTVSSQISEHVQSFLIQPGPGRRCALLVGGDKAFFPVRITATRAERKISPETVKDGSAKSGTGGQDR